MIRIAVDAMGGDLAPEATVAGALACAGDPRCDFEIVLVGDEQRVRALVPRGSLPSNVSLVHAAEVIEMDDPVTSLRAKPDSSIVRALELHKAGEVQGFLSAGNSGAVMAASTLILGRIAGISRPTIGTFLPSQNEWTLLIDAGANVDSKPLHLQQFAIMGSIFTELMRGIDRPKVGLISIGEEEGKGDSLTVEAYELLKKAPVNFIGNIEGRDVLRGTADVAVCDGFVGNIILKFAESVPGMLKHALGAQARKSIADKLRIGAALAPMRRAMKTWDYQEAGGVPLLGVNGISLIGHGSSTPRAVTNMIFKAKEMIDRRVHEHIADAIAALSAQAS